MRKIITLLIMALLMAGTAVVDAKVNKRQTKKKRQTTTATTKTRKKARPAAQQTSQHDKFYGQWTSAHGTTFTIEYGPYLDLVGAGKFSGKWTSDGKLYVSFGYPDEITLRYSDGFLYDGNGRMYWRVGQ